MLVIIINTFFQAELIRLVKQLERLKTDYQSTLNDTEHQLDVQAKVSVVNSFGN